MCCLRSCNVLHLWTNQDEWTFNSFSKNKLAFWDTWIFSMCHQIVFSSHQFPLRSHLGHLGWPCISAYLEMLPSTTVNTHRDPTLLLSAEIPAERNSHTTKKGMISRVFPFEVATFRFETKCTTDFHLNTLARIQFENTTSDDTNHFCPVIGVSHLAQ